MNEHKTLPIFERIVLVVEALFKDEPKTFRDREPVIKEHLEKTRTASTRLSLVKHATAAYGMIMAGGKDVEHIENIKTEGAFEGYLLLLRDVADEPRISEGLAYSYGSQAAENSFVNQSNMYLRQDKKVSSSPLCDRFFGPYGNRKIPSESLLRQVISAPPEEVERILSKLPAV